MKGRTALSWILRSGWPPQPLQVHKIFDTHVVPNFPRGAADDPQRDVFQERAVAHHPHDNAPGARALVLERRPPELERVAVADLQAHVLEVVQLPLRPEL